MKKSQWLQMSICALASFALAADATPKLRLDIESIPAVRDNIPDTLEMLVSVRDAISEAMAKSGEGSVELSFPGKTPEGKAGIYSTLARFEDGNKVLCRRDSDGDSLAADTKKRPLWQHYLAESEHVDLPAENDARFPPDYMPVSPKLDEGCFSRLLKGRRDMASITGVVDVVVFGNGPCAEIIGASRGFSRIKSGPFKGLSVLVPVSGKTPGEVLWHSCIGGLDGFTAKNVIISVSPGGDAEDSVEAVKRLIGIVVECQPKARVIITPDLPNGDEARRGMIERYNADVGRLFDASRVFFCNCVDLLSAPSESPEASLLDERLFPTALGREAYSKALLMFLKR